MLEIGKYSMVTLTYDLRVEDEKGEVVEQATTEQPLEFLYGAGAMLPKFESHLSGLKEGQPFTIKLAKEDAYGDINNEAIVELPKHVFLVDDKFDDELIKEIERDLPAIPHVFISSVAQTNLDKLKDLIWQQFD